MRNDISSLNTKHSAKQPVIRACPQLTSVNAWQTAPALPSILSSSVISLSILSWSAMHSCTSLSLT